MDNSSSKMDSMKPVLFRAGLPLALSLAAGFILARITVRKVRLPPASLQQSQNHDDIQEPDSEESFHSIGSECPPHVDDDHHTYGEAYRQIDVFGPSSCLEAEIMELNRRIEAMQDREWELEKQFLHYHNLKDQEMVLMEHLNKMMLEMNRVDFLVREIPLLEIIAMDYMNLLMLRLENEKLHKRVKKLLRKNKEQSLILRKQTRQIQSKETKISRNRKDQELMEDEIKELRLVVERLQREKNELWNKLREAEESAGSKAGEETVSMEKYNQLASEMERLKNEATEVEELTYLRWSNACLRHELTRRNGEQEGTNVEGIETSRGNVGPEELYIRSNTQNRSHSRRRKLITKFKRWMEGGENNNKRRLDHDGNKCFPRHSVSEDHYLDARNSCASV